MSRTTSLATATTALLLGLGSLTACGPVTHQLVAPAAGAPTTPAPQSSAPDTPADPTATTGSSGGGVPGLPASVWLASRAIPMDSTYHWNALAGAAKAASNPTYEFERLCNSTRDPSNDLSDWKGPAGQASIGTGDSADWQVSQTVIHFPGNTNTAVQTAYQLYQGLKDELNACPTSAPGATVRVTTSDVTTRPGDSDLAAIVTVPNTSGGTFTLHEYLTVTDSAVVELTVRSDRPTHPWSAPADATVLRSLESPICPVFKDC